MKIVERALQNGGIALGTAAILVAIALAHSEWTTRKPLRVEASKRFLGELEPGTILDLEVTIHNRGGIPVHLIGADDRCGHGGCSDTMGLPTEIPAHGSGQIRIQFKAGSTPGSISYPLTIFTDYPSQDHLPFNILGSVVPQTHLPLRLAKGDASD